MEEIEKVERLMTEIELKQAYLKGYYAGQKATLNEWLAVERMDKSQQFGWAMSKLLNLTKQ